MKDSSLSRRRRIKLKLLVSFNGAFRRRPPSLKLRYVGGETRIISVDGNTSFQLLKSKIAALICGSFDNCAQFCLKYHVSESLCGDNGEEEGPVLGKLESDDEVRCMIQQYETMEFEGKVHTRIWIFVCNVIDGFDDIAFVDNYSVVNVNGDRFCGKNNGFVKPIMLGLDGDDKRVSENLVVLSNKYENKAKKLGDDSLRKMVLKQQLLAKNLDGIRSFCGSREQSDEELAVENGICQSSPKQLCSESRSPKSKNLNTVGDPYREKLLDCKRKNGRILTTENSGKISPVAESNFGSLNSGDGNLYMRCEGSNGSLSGQSRIIFGNRNGNYMSSSKQFLAAEKSRGMSFNSSINCMVKGLDPNCELGTFHMASLRNIDSENIVPQNGACNVMKWGLVAPTCRYPSGSGAYPLESLQTTESQQRAYGGCIRDHIFGPSEARNRRASPYHIRNRSNVTELGNHQNYSLDRKTWKGKLFPMHRSSSNTSNHGPLSRSPGMLLSSSHRYEIRGKKGATDDDTMLNPLCCGEENLLKLIDHIVPQQGRANLDDCQVANAGKSLLPIRNPLLGTRAVNLHVGLFISSGIAKIDLSDQSLGENSLDLMGMGGQNPLNNVVGPHSENQSSSPPSPCKSTVTVLSSKNKLLDGEGGHETSDIHQKGAKYLKINGASAVDLSLDNLSLESDGKVQLPVCYARGHLSEAFLEPQSNGMDLMDAQQISLRSNEKSTGVSSDSSSSNVSICNNGDDKREAVQHNPESDSRSAEKDENKKSSSHLKGNDGIPADIVALYAHLATRGLQIIKNADLEYVKELGHGTYGTVYHGKWKGSDVAIKRIKPCCFTAGAKEEDRLVADFWKEAHTLGQLHHPNVLSLYGVVIDGPVNFLATVTEYMVNGSLKQVLRRKDRTIDRRKRLIIAMDAAFGMEYLHWKNIVHFDLKSHNFLVNMRDPRRPICKIGDLGLSKVKQRTLVSGGIRGTIPWMAPELLSERKLVSEKVDVFSFGIVMWELLTCEEPYANMRSEEIIAGIIRGNLRPEIPSWCDPSWRSLMERCWSSNPDCRPSFSEIAKELRAMAASMNIK